jgi:hypothetical protein
MAKKETEAIATVPAGLEGMITTARPEGADTGALGSEHIGREDILIPRLALAQKTSPEIDPTSGDRYIEGLQFTDLFHSITHKAYGKGPLHFVILRADKPRWVEFNPLDQGGGIKDPNVPADDPRTKFGVPDDNGQSAPPLATKFYDFIILLLDGLDFTDPLQNVMGLSMKSTALKVARQLNLYIQQRGKKALYKGVYQISTGSDKNAKGAFAIYKVKNAGWLQPGSQIEALAAEMFESWKDKVVAVDTETAHPDEVVDDSFDTEKMDAEATSQM